jgi:hypothetical protein
MPSVFDSRFAASAFHGLLSQFGESITYWPGFGGSRIVDAIINRDPPELIDGSGNAIKPAALIQVYNSRRNGIESLELDTGRDKIEFPLRIDDQRTTLFSLMVLQSSSGGVTVLAAI